MKVLTKGTGQRSWAKEYACTGKGNKGGGCGAVLLVEQTDLFQTGKHYIDGTSDYYTTFKCPECGVLTDIPNSDPPKSGNDLPTYKSWLQQQAE